jgi:hypothetical protein
MNDKSNFNNLKIGILGCGFNCEEHIHEVLSPWIELKKEYPEVFHFSFVHRQFTEYVKINGLQEAKNPDWYPQYAPHLEFFSTGDPVSEAEARNVALMPLLDKQCDLIWLLDLQDEFYTREEILKIIQFVQDNPLVAWFKGSLKNYVFSDSCFLKEPFNPARIYRTKYNNYKLHGFRFDNEMVYHGTITRDIKDHLVMPHLTIPQHIGWVRHLTWLNDEKSKKKAEYQRVRWGDSMCSYRWNHEENKLEFNPLYFKKFGKPLPELGYG